MSLSTNDESQAVVEMHRLRTELARVRSLLEAERAAWVVDMVAGGRELEVGHERLERQRGLNGVLRQRLVRVRERARDQAALIDALETDLARYRASRLARAAAALGGRRRRSAGSTKR